MHALLAPFCSELEEAGAGTRTVRLYDKRIEPCVACRACQKDISSFGCAQRDDVQEIFDQVLAADLIVLATPIYAWYANASLALQYCLNTKGTRHRLTYYDANSNIGLLQTLTEFIRTSYNTSQTARNLHVHRQSLLYRLEKIQALTGMSLSEHDDLFVLETFSRIYASF